MATLSFFFPSNIDYNQVRQEVKNIAGADCQSVSIFDVYQSPELEKKGQKSVSFHLIFQSPHKTLTNQEVEEILIRISKEIEKLFNAKLRE